MAHRGAQDSSTGQISYRPDEAKEGEEVVDFHAADVGQLRRRLTKGTTVEFLIITDLDGQQRALQVKNLHRSAHAEKPIGMNIMRCQ